MLSCPGGPRVEGGMLLRLAGALLRVALGLSTLARLVEGGVFWVSGVLVGGACVWSWAPGAGFVSARELCGRLFCVEA